MNGTLWFLLFFLPAYVGNMTPVFFRRINIFNYPLDGGKKWNGKPLLGKNKTWRGLITGTIFGGIAGAFMQWLGLPFTWWWGFILGFAALLGDALKSMIKRQIGIRPGGRWMPFDQLDFIIVAYGASLFFVRFPLKEVFFGFLTIFLGTIAVQLIGGWTKLKADSL